MTADSVYVVSGIPGAGKTTVARLLARRFPVAAHIESDAIQALIVSGGRLPGEEPRAEWERQLRLRTRNVSLLADSFFAAGVVPVIDDVVVGPRLEHYLAELHARPVTLVVLAPPVETALARDAGREKRVAHLWTHLDGELRTTLAGRGLWLDTERLSAEETVAAIVERAGEGRVA